LKLGFKDKFGKTLKPSPLSEETAGKRSKAMDKNRVDLLLIASGGGTDADSIMRAWKGGCIPEVGKVTLISTKPGAGCLEKAGAWGSEHTVVLPENKGLSATSLLSAIAELGGADLIFLVGCIVRVPEVGIPIYNIHPADPHLHGGQGMYGLAVHLHVLNSIRDQINRGMGNTGDRFFTKPTVHEVVSAYDQGATLLQALVEIPQQLVQSFVIGEFTGQEEMAAKKLQEIVLPREWQMLPCAVRLAASKIL
jgi:folate-dependent phosphoribosylglycinamide formyltransferase PurN